MNKIIKAKMPLKITYIDRVWFTLLVIISVSECDDAIWTGTRNAIILPMQRFWNSLWLKLLLALKYRDFDFTHWMHKDHLPIYIYNSLINEFILRNRIIN